MTWDDMVTVGRIARTQGHRGHVIVDPATDFPEARYKAGSTVYMRREDAVAPLVISEARIHKGRPVIAIEGVDTMNAAEELAGCELRVPVEALQPLPPGMFYEHDLIGCSVETPEGLPIGQVARVESTGSASRLVVQGRGGGEILIPMTEAIVTGIHLAARRIVVQPPDGLLDVNVTRRQRF